MKDLNRRKLITAIVSLLFALIYVFPTLALYVALATVAYAQYVSMFFVLMFAWNIAGVVEYKYREYLEEKDGKSD
jgi:ABC-type dipeptide/oligopeptide/nickel transport system permease subunit